MNAARSAAGTSARSIVTSSTGSVTGPNARPGLSSMRIRHAIVAAPGHDVRRPRRDTARLPDRHRQQAQELRRA